MARDGARGLALHSAKAVLLLVQHTNIPVSGVPLYRLCTMLWISGRSFMSAFRASSAVSHLMRSRPLTASMPLQNTELRVR